MARTASLVFLLATTLLAQDPRLDWWREARFGLFIHWGLYAIPAGAWGERADYGEWIQHSAQIPVAEYERLQERFDPVEFDADAWVRIAKAAGMRYVVITSKHHDGFCLFDSALTDYDVMATPFRRDILRELADACRRHGLRICWYHSIMDWHHPDYLPRRDWEDRSADGADFARYVRHLHGQVEELLTNYGEIGVMWFDGEWERTWTHELGAALYDLCRKLQPSVIVNNRVDKGRGGMAGMTKDATYRGDFGTPEQEIPSRGLPGVDWETCMTMNGHWGFNARDTRWKSSRDLIRKLVDIASKGGNFLLNVGPRADGTFPPACVERLAAMGAWLDVYGEAIHGTAASPFAELAWGRCTRRARGTDTRLYLHVFDWPADGALVVPGLGNDVLGASLLAGGEALEVARAGGDVRIALPAAMPDADCTVVALDVRGAPMIYETPRIVAAAEVLVDALDVELRVDSADLVVRYTTDGSAPTAASARYEAPIRLTATAEVRARTFHDGRAVSAVASRRFEKVTPRPAITPDGDTEPGLACAVFAGTFDRMPDFAALSPFDSTVAATVALPPGAAEEHVARRFAGYLTVERDAVYAFALTSDDGSRLWIDGELVVDNDGLHSTEERTGTVPLAAGAHRIAVEWFNKTGGAELSLRMAAAGADPAPIPAAALRH